MPPKAKQLSCEVQHTKKYQTRASPPRPANACCGMTTEGNDGNMYVSSPNKNGVCSWRKIGSKPAVTPKRSRSPAPRRNRSPSPKRVSSPKKALRKSPTFKQFMASVKSPEVLSDREIMKRMKFSVPKNKKYPSLPKLDFSGKGIDKYNSLERHWPVTRLSVPLGKRLSGHVVRLLVGQAAYEAEKPTQKERERAFQWSRISYKEPGILVDNDETDELVIFDNDVLGLYRLWISNHPHGRGKEWVCCSGGESVYVMTEDIPVVSRKIASSPKGKISPRKASRSAAPAARRASPRRRVSPRKRVGFAS